MNSPAVSKPRDLSDYLLRIPLVRGVVAGARASMLICDAKPEDGEPIVIAVHGTWAARAGWTRGDSLLLKNLRMAWPKSGIYRFQWSGVNGAGPRLDASLELARQIDHLAKSYPHSEIVAIAHSHGGNVVAWASTRVKRPLAAAVYLNTPFIQVLKQDKTSHVVLQILIGILFPIICPLLIAMLQLMQFPKRWDDSGILFFSAAGMALALIWVMQAKLPSKVDEMRDWLIRVSNGERSIRTELVLFVVGDEPSAALGAVYFTQWLGRKVIWLLIAGGLVFTAFSVAFHKDIPGYRVNPIGPWMIFSVFAILILIFIVAMSAYGMVHSLVALDSSIAITPAPIGEVDFATISWKTKDTLRHSLIYSSTEAVATILKWLEGRVSPK